MLFVSLQFKGSVYGIYDRKDDCIGSQKDTTSSKINRSEIYSFSLEIE